MKNDNYWTRRFQQAEQDTYKQTQRYIQNVQKQYKIAQKRLEKDMLKWYNRLAGNNKISYADALKLLDDESLEEFK